MNAHNEQQARALAELTSAAGLMLSEIDSSGHEVDPAYRATLFDAWEQGKAALAASPVVKQNLTTQPAAAQEAVGLIVEALKNSQPFAHIYPEAMKRHADALATAEALLSGAAPVTAAPGVYLATAWAEGYRSGVTDERISESNIGIAGFGAKIEPARANPYLIDASPKGALNEQFGSAERLESPKGGRDPWRGLYAPERAPNRDEYGCFYHPDIPSWDDEREESIAPLLKAHGFDFQCVPGDFSDEAMEEGGERYWQEMREWNPEPEGDGWRLVAIYDTEDGPYSMFVKPLAQAGDAEVQP